MTASRVNLYFFLGLLALAGVGVFFMFEPFLSAVVLAATFAVLFSGSYRFFRKISFGSATSGALLTCLFVTIIVVVPMLSVVSLSIQEANSFYHSEEGATLLRQVSSALGESGVSGLVSGSIGNGDVPSAIQDFGGSAASVFGVVFQNVISFVLWLFVFFFTLFYFLVDGKRMLGARHVAFPASG
jgi:predicted PurR-regulated permease PerM